MTNHMVKNYIDGEWIVSQSTRLSDVHNPATGEVIAQVPMSTTEEVNQAVDAVGSRLHLVVELSFKERVILNVNHGP